MSNRKQIKRSGRDHKRSQYPSDESTFLRLRVETAGGVFIRSIPKVRKLGLGDVGKEGEVLAKNSATEWGLPDFIYEPKVIDVGSGQREIGDALLIVGQLGACVQVKAREKNPADPVEEKAWLDKRIPRAISQANGTIRTLAKKKSERLTNLRGREIEIQCGSVNWIPVVVLDHEGLESYVPQKGAIVMILGDWNFLFDQLKSTSAILNYLNRIWAEDPISLGMEAVRYYSFAAADAIAQPSDIPEALRIKGSVLLSGPILPQAPAANDGLRGHSVIRMICEDISNLETDVWTEQGRLEILEVLDSVPVSSRTEHGEKVLKWLDEVRSVDGSYTKIHARHLLSRTGPHIMLAVSNLSGDDKAEMFASYVSLRREQLLQRHPDLERVYSVGILLTPSENPDIFWGISFAVATGGHVLTAEDIASLETIWNSLET